LDHIEENDSRLQKTYRDTAEIEEDVNALHSSINSLIESLGLDPNVMESSHRQDDLSTIIPSDPVISSASTAGADAQGDPLTQDFDFDQFLTDLSRQGEENTDYTQFADKLDQSTLSDASTTINNPSPEQLTTFLEEVQVPLDDSIPPVTSFRSEIELKRGSKRKSEVAGISEEHNTGRRTMKLTSPAGMKSKRKR